jgi:predicted RNA-binding Zn-ribbon protein involved in translation (DUF1610 family)
MARMTTPTHAQQTANRLRVSAASYARSALIHVTSDDDRVRGAIDAGVAVEHMVKALLATLSPALLAHRNADLDTMLHLTGFGQLAKCSPHEVKTISAHEACLRCARIVPEFTYTHQADQALFVARNGGVHLALTTDEVARESARIMVRLLEPLIKSLNLDRGEFWGDMESVADTLLDEKASQISAAVEMKVAAAKSRLEARLAGLGASERELVVKALSAHPLYTKDEEPYECPACGQTGVVACELHDVGQPEFDYEQVAYDDFIYHGGHIDQMAYAVNFDCNTCGLDLDYDEMTAADMLTEFEREPRDCEPWEFDDDRD